MDEQQALLDGFIEKTGLLVGALLLALSVHPFLRFSLGWIALAAGASLLCRLHYKTASGVKGVLKAFGR